jgi:hypothetical protein
MLRRQGQRLPSEPLKLLPFITEMIPQKARSKTNYRISNASMT